MTTDPGSGEPSADPFSDLDAYLALPRLSGLALSPDGSRLIVGVGLPDGKRTRYTTALWEVDPEGVRPARRLTRSMQGESQPAFTPAGDLLFVSSRPGEDGEPAPALWLQPADGGDARRIAAPAGGVSGLVVALDGTVVFGSAMMPSARDAEQDAALRAERKGAGASAILHEEFPIRLWDHDLGPDRGRLFAAELPNGDSQLDARDLTGHIGRALGQDAAWDIAPDGRTVVTGWMVPEAAGSQRSTVVAIDVATGGLRVLADSPDIEYSEPRVSPDGTMVAVNATERATPDEPGRRYLCVVPSTGGAIRPLTADWDRLPSGARWTPDGTALVVAADDHGRSPLWRIDAATGDVTRLTHHDGAYTDARISPDGRWVYALHSAVDSPPTPVRIALDGEPGLTPLRGPAATLDAEVSVPGRLEEVTTTAADGTPLRAWLAMPHGATADSPAPLLLWIHGGPVMSYSAWSWRWNPWIAVAAGYAVLLPDPALSTGYGLDFIRRGWKDWGGTPFTDLMTVTDAAVARPDIDADRTAAMGGSFGGYMANWIAGHTDRFKAIVTHASVWHLEQSDVTGDAAHLFVRMTTPEIADRNSPHHAIDAITTPMLVIHGDKDYRVPIGEALRLWWDLSSRSQNADGSSPHKFLYFPDEGHWILKPANTKTWYATVLAFLSQHVHGQDWHRPDLIG